MSTASTHTTVQSEMLRKGDQNKRVRNDKTAMKTLQKMEINNEEHCHKQEGLR